MQWQKKERKNHALATHRTAATAWRHSPSPFPPPFPPPYQQGSGIGMGSHQCCMFPRTQTKKTWFQVQLMITRTPSVWYTTPATTWTRTMPLSLSLSQSEFCHYNASKTDFEEWYYQDNDNAKEDRSLNKNDKSFHESVWQWMLVRNLVETRPVFRVKRAPAFTANQTRIWLIIFI